MTMYNDIDWRAEQDKLTGYNVVSSGSGVPSPDILSDVNWSLEEQKLASANTIPQMPAAPASAPSAEASDLTIPPASMDTGADLPSAAAPTEEELAASRERMAKLNNSVFGTATPDLEQIAVAPVLEVMDAINSNIYGTAYDLAIGAPTVAVSAGLEYMGKQPIEYVKPSVFKNKQFVSDTDAAAMYDTAALFATYGVAFKGAAQKAVASWAPQFLAPTRATTVGGKISQDIRAGAKEVTRLTAESPLAVEAGVAVTAAAAGAGVEDPTLKLLSEVGGGLLGGVITTAPRQAVETAASAIAKEFGITEKQAVNAAGALRASADNPNLASVRLMESDSPLSLAAQTGDEGIMTLERTLAQNGGSLGLRADEGIDLATQSLLRELKEIYNPDGTINTEAFTTFVSSRIDDLTSQISDRIALGQKRISEILSSGDLNASEISRQAKAEMDSLIADISKQESVLWTPVSESNTLIPTSGLKDRLIQMVRGFGADVDLDATTKGIIERYLGVKIGKTADGWDIRYRLDEKTGELTKVPVNTAETLSRAQKGIESDYIYTLPDNVSPSVLADERSKLLRVLRSLQRSTESGSAKVNPKTYSDLQQILIDTLEEGSSLIAPELKQAYQNALKFTKTKHDVLDRSAILSTAVKKGAPAEKVLETLIPVGGRSTAAETAQGLASREVKELISLWREAGSPSGNSSAFVKNMEQYLLRRLATIDASDDASVNLWLDENRTFINQFPEIGKAILDAAAKIKAQNKRVSTLESRKERAINSKFVALTGGKTATRVMQDIINSDNPVGNASRLSRRLAGNSDARLAFKRSVGREFFNDIVGWVAKASEKGAPIQAADYKRLTEALDKYSPFLNSFFTPKEREMLTYAQGQLLKISKATAARAAPSVAGQKPVEAVLIEVLARTGLYKALSGATGVSSFAITGAVGNLSKRAAAKVLSRAENAELLELALKNKELMNLLLDPSITLDKLASYKRGGGQGAHLIMRLYGLDFATGGNLRPENNNQQ